MAFWVTPKEHYVSLAKRALHFRIRKKTSALYRALQLDPGPRSWWPLQRQHQKSPIPSACLSKREPRFQNMPYLRPRSGCVIRWTPRASISKNSSCFVWYDVSHNVHECVCVCMRVQSWLLQKSPMSLQKSPIFPSLSLFPFFPFSFFVSCLNPNCMTFSVSLSFSTHCSARQHTATQCNTPRCIVLEEGATHCITMQHARLFSFEEELLHCSKLQHTAAHWSALQHFAPHCNSMHHTRVCSLEEEPLHCNTLQHTATHCNTLQHTATYCNMIQHIDMHSLEEGLLHCNTLQYTATHCSTLQHIEHARMNSPEGRGIPPPPLHWC